MHHTIVKQPGSANTAQQNYTSLSLCGLPVALGWVCQLSACLMAVLALCRAALLGACSNS